MRLWRHLLCAFLVVQHCANDINCRSQRPLHFWFNKFSCKMHTNRGKRISKFFFTFFEFFKKLLTVAHAHREGSSVTSFFNEQNNSGPWGTNFSQTIYFMTNWLYYWSTISFPIIPVLQGPDQYRACYCDLLLVYKMRWYCTWLSRSASQSVNVFYTIIKSITIVLVSNYNKNLSISASYTFINPH